jgi:hypothetical protein
MIASGMAVSGGRIFKCVVGQNTVPPALRASDADRENAIEILRKGSVQGRLTHDTFLSRVDIALRARGIDELADLLRDLPPPAQKDGRLVRAVRWWSAVDTRVRQAWRTPRLPRLGLPRADRAFVIGRAPHCDLALANMTVSWRHAELRRSPDGWVLVDLGSTNGTRVNGWQAGTGFAVRAGDRVSFGSAVFRITD